MTTSEQQAVPVAQVSEAIRKAKMHAGRVLGISWCNLEEISRVELILAALTPDATQTREAEGGLTAFGAAMFQRIWDSFTDDGWDIGINDLVTVEAVKAGLVSVTPYDPEVHSDGSGAAEPGDDFYEVTPAGRAALNGRDGA